MKLPKSCCRKLPKRFGIDPKEDRTSPQFSFIRMDRGKALVAETHERDLNFTDEDGNKSSVGKVVMRAGEYIFPSMYFHPEKLFVGETIDVQFIPSIDGWAVRLKGCMRDVETGEPIEIDGERVDLSGWYLESALIDAEIGAKMIRPGSSGPSIAEIIKASTNSARKHGAIRSGADRVAREDAQKDAEGLPEPDPKDIARQAAHRNAARKARARALERTALVRQEPVKPQPEPESLVDRRHISGFVLL